MNMSDNDIIPGNIVLDADNVEDNYTITVLLDRISRLESICCTTRDALLIGSLSRAEIGHWVEEQMVKRSK